MSATTATRCVPRTLALLAVVAVALFAAARASAAQSPPDAVRTELDGLVAVTSLARGEGGDARELEVGQSIEIRVRLEGAAAARATIETPRTLGDFDVLSATQPVRVADGVFEATIVVSTLESGERTPPALPLRWLVDGSLRRGEAALPALAIASLVGDEFDPAGFRDIAGELPPPGTGPPWVALAVIALFLLAAVGAILWGVLRRGPAAPPEPDAWALAELARLSAEGLPARREYGRFADALSGIVRRYAALRFAIPAEKLTTREFVRAAESHAEFPPDETVRLRSLLTLADLVRFAHAEPDSSECDAQLAEAQRLVEATRPRPETGDGSVAAPPAARTEVGR
ncbi:MAG: hypothetical protein GC172_10180 [Phycisphaera sp.]|nr:hypothetical protein [Phycisphaera sp.]